MNFDEELISFVCQKYNIDITDFHATLLDFVNEKRNTNSDDDEPQKLEKDDDIETISQKAKAAVQPQQQNDNNDSELFNQIENDNDTKNKTRDEKKQDRVFEPGQRVKINTNYGTSKEPHYLVGEFVEDIDNENVKVKLLSTGRPRTVDKKSIVLTESALFNKILFS